MRANVAGLCLSLVFSAAACLAQEAPAPRTQFYQPTDHPWFTSVYCSGFYTNQKVSDDLRLVTGEQSASKITFATPDIVHLSKGANQGIKPADRFLVVRQEEDPNQVMWFQ